MSKNMSKKVSAKREKKLLIKNMYESEGKKVRKK